MKMKSLQDLFVTELKDIYNAEKQILKALPKMAKKAQDPDLQESFKMHLEQTRGQVDRLERIFDSLDTAPRGKTCKAMQGLVEEGEEILEMDGDADVLDAALISAAQKVEHYEIASYGCARTYARQLGLKDAEQLLQETLDEEAETDKKLTMLAERGINQEAAQK